MGKRKRPAIRLRLHPQQIEARQLLGLGEGDLLYGSMRDADKSISVYEGWRATPRPGQIIWFDEATEFTAEQLQQMIAKARGHQQCP